MGRALYDNLWIKLVHPDGQVRDHHYGDRDSGLYMKVTVDEGVLVTATLTEVELIASNTVWVNSQVTYHDRVDAIHRILHHLKLLKLVEAASI
jgi:hypothetical protein